MSGMKTPPPPSIEEASAQIPGGVSDVAHQILPINTVNGSVPGKTIDGIDYALHYLMLEPVDDVDIQKRLVLTFLGACSISDWPKAKYLLDYRPEIVTVDCQDSEGTTGLMVASCFGHLSVVTALIAMGANLDLQDKHGWTALMWATNNSHDTIVEFLLGSGANANTRSASGKTVLQFIERAHLPGQSKLETIFHNEVRTQNMCNGGGSGDENTIDDDTASIGGATTLTTATALTNDSYYVPSLRGVDYQELCDIVGTTIPAALQGIIKTDKAPLVVDPEVYILEEDEALVEFSYEQCLPDQMLVFSENSLDRLLNVVMRHLSDPQLIRSHNNNLAGFTRRPISANILFLAARYAGYCVSQELLDKLLSQSLQILETLVTTYRSDMMVLGYWLSNCSRLLYYLKKDSELVMITLHHQAHLNEAIHDIFSELVRDAQRRLEIVMDEALLDHDTIPGFNTIKFQERARKSVKPTLSESVTVRSKLSSYFSGSGNATSNVMGSGGSTGSGGNRSIRMYRRNVKHQPYTPKSVSTILSSTLYVMQTFHIHTSLVHQALEQLFYYIGAATFNRLLSRPELCCRWKAMQIRMNVSHIEEWVRSNEVPAPSKDTFTKHLQPTISMLQMLQIITHLKDLPSFLEALAESNYMNILNWSQLRRAIDIYVYEVDEAKVPDDIYGYIIHSAEQQLANTTTSEVEDDDENIHHKQQKTNVDMLGNGNDTVSQINSEHVQSFLLPQELIIQNDAFDPIEEQTCLPSPPPISLNVNSPVVHVTATVVRAYITAALSTPIDAHSDNGHNLPAMTSKQHLKLDLLSSALPLQDSSLSNANESTTITDTYGYHLYDEKYWLPFAVPSNVGERTAMRIVNDEEKCIEEVPVISEEVVTMLDANNV